MVSGRHMAKELFLIFLGIAGACLLLAGTILFADSLLSQTALVPVIFGGEQTNYALVGFSGLALILIALFAKGRI